MSKDIYKDGAIHINHSKTVYVGSLMGLTFRNGKLIANGVNIDEFEKATKDQKVINITIEGSVGHLDVDSCTTIVVQGTANHVKTNMGDINVEGNVEGDVHTNMGDINCGNVEGDCTTNMGDIRRVAKKGGEE